jgi:hypothetical protein
MEDVSSRRLLMSMDGAVLRRLRLRSGDDSVEKVWIGMPRRDGGVK